MLDIIKVHPEIKKFIRFCEGQDSRFSNTYLESLVELYAKEYPGGYINSLFHSFNYGDIIFRAVEDYSWNIADHWDVVTEIAEEIGEADANEGVDNYRVNQCIEKVYKRSSLEIRALAVSGYESDLVESLQNEVKLVITGTWGLNGSLEDMVIAVDHSISFLLDDKKWQSPYFSDTLRGWLSLASGEESSSSSDIYYFVGGGWVHDFPTDLRGLMYLGGLMQVDIGKQVRIEVVTPVKAALKTEAIQRLNEIQGEVSQ